MTAGAMVDLDMERSELTPFANEPFVDFSEAGNRRAIAEALAAVHGQLGREYEMVIGGRRLKTNGKIVSVNPARPAEVVGTHQAATEVHVDGAMQAAQAAFATWSRRPVEERATLLLRVAAMVREHYRAVFA